ncbi:hypothetical protein Cadr_000007809 [Camelus dromedarius]|uniref:Uncharacterized protein n=1 Tax=Camelus dromedarius TaxID=9838 RepID=A0A5N4DZA0_CAMDR|nr:hypothetical protein Cadr_000007809 [Camelus dromedarius]
MLTSKSVPDSQFTLKASVRGLELIIRGNPGITGDSDADKFTENLCTEVLGGEFSATLLVAAQGNSGTQLLPKNEDSCQELETGMQDLLRAKKTNITKRP